MRWRAVNGLTFEPHCLDKPGRSVPRAGVIDVCLSAITDYLLSVNASADPLQMGSAHPELR